MDISSSFLGRGWSFPPQFNRSPEEVKMLEGDADIQSSLEILLSTRLGERIMVPNFGCNLDEMLFQSLDLTLKTYVIDLIKTAILYHESRIEVNEIKLFPDRETEGLLLIDIDYTIRTTNSRRNMVYPFFKGEGNER